MAPAYRDRIKIRVLDVVRADPASEAAAAITAGAVGPCDALAACRREKGVRLTAAQLVGETSVDINVRLERRAAALRKRVAGADVERVVFIRPEIDGAIDAARVGDARVILPVGGFHEPHRTICR